MMIILPALLVERGDYGHSCLVVSPSHLLTFVVVDDNREKRFCQPYQRHIRPGFRLVGLPTGCGEDSLEAGYVLCPYRGG